MLQIGTMASADPAFLPLGTEVSAKYRGAFCEAKVKKIVKALKIKVQYQPGGTGVVTHEEVEGPLKAGCTVQVKYDEEPKTATILKITDSSMYTVVFDDGDENTLRRTQLCLKSEKHFNKYETLDDLPLTHPEHFGTPVLKGKHKKRRAAASPHSSTFSRSDSESEEESDEPAPRQYPGRLVEMIGKVLLMTQEDRKKTMIVPVLVVQPNVDPTELKTRDHLLVKSFKDSKFYAVTKKEAKEFTREAALKNDDKTLKPVYEKALLYFDAKELPPHWDKDLFGSDSEDDDDDDVSSDDEQSEEKDMFVAQLYKFMDERGTPINKAPLIGSRDLNLYRLSRAVHKLGGYNRVTNQMKWRLVYSKMGLPNSGTAANQIKAAYKRYLHAFEDFYRKLGSSMGTNISRPSRSPRHSSGRPIQGFRERDRPDSMSPKSPRTATVIVKEAKKDEATDSNDEKKEIVPKPVSTPTESKSSRKLAEGWSDTESISPSKRKTRGGLEDKITPKTTPKEIKETKRSVSRTDVESVSDKDDVNKKNKRAKQDDEEAKGEETETESHKSETDSNQGSFKGSTSSSTTPKLKSEYPIGTRLRVRYGKGKMQQVFQAKVLDYKVENGNPQWLVHYAGWNNRYDEWVKKDHVVGVVQLAESKSDGSKDLKKSVPQTPKTSGVSTPKVLTNTQFKSPTTQSKPTSGRPSMSPHSGGKPAASGATKADAVSSETSTQEDPTPGRSAKPTPSPGTNKQRGTLLLKKRSLNRLTASNQKDEKSQVKVRKAKAPRPTRSTSLESSLSIGLSPRKRPRRNSGYTETSEQDDSSGAEASGEENSDSEDRVPSPKSDKADSFEKTQRDSKEKSEEIMKELLSDIEFDKASQDSLEREMDIEPTMPTLPKSEPDIESILSCLNKDYKVQSSENESTVSDADRTASVGRGRPKTKSDTSVKSKAESVPSVKGAKAEAQAKSPSDDMGKGPGTRAKTDSAKSKPEPPKTKAQLKAKPDIAHLRASEEVSKEKCDDSVVKEESAKPQLEMPKPEMLEQSKASEKSTATNSALSPRASDKKTPDNEDIKQDVKSPIQPSVERKVSEEALTKGIELEPFDLPTDSEALTPKTELKEESSESNENSAVKSEPPKNNDKSDAQTKPLDKSVDKVQTDSSSNDEMKDKDVEKRGKGEVKKPLKGKGRGKRKVEENVESEVEPPRKVTRRKAKQEGGESSVSSAGAEDSNQLPDKNKDETVEMETSQESIENISENTSQSIEASASNLQSTQPFSPSGENIENEDQSAISTDKNDNSQDSLNTFDLRGAVVSASKAESEDEAVNSPAVSQESTAAPSTSTGFVPAAVASHEQVKSPAQSQPTHNASEKPTPKPISTVPDTPPSTPEFIVPEERPPNKCEHVSENASTKSEIEANLEVESYLQGALPPGGQSPGIAMCEYSNISTASDDSDHVLKSSKNSSCLHSPAAATARKKADDSTTTGSGRKRKRKGAAKNKQDSKPVLSEEDDTSNQSRAALSDSSKPRHGVGKYNFIQQLEEVKCLEGEARVNFLFTKIAELRSMYMQLKQEVASIDRRRKRQRKKQRLAACQSLLGLEKAI